MTVRSPNVAKFHATNPFDGRYENQNSARWANGSAYSGRAYFLNGWLFLATEKQ